MNSLGRKQEQTNTYSLGFEEILSHYLIGAKAQTVTQAHQKAVAAAEVALLEKLKMTSRKMGESVGTESEFYDSVPTRFINAEINQRKATQ